MFVCQGAALLILKYPGGEVSYDFALVFVGDVIPDILPAPIVVVVIALLVWFFIRNTRLGIALYAIGSDPLAAAYNRVDVRFTRFMSFTLAGMFFGAAGLFITANTGSGDPLIGATMLLKVFAAVVLGGTLIGGGRGGAVGTVFGALTLTIIVNIFLVLGVRTYYRADRRRRRPDPRRARLHRDSADLPFIAFLRDAARPAPRPAPEPRAPHCCRYRGRPRRRRHRRVGSSAMRATLRIVLARLHPARRGDRSPRRRSTGQSFTFGNYLVTLLIFGTFLAILGLGQGAVIIAGGLDLSVAWTITFPAIVVTTYANGSDARRPGRSRSRSASARCIGLVQRRAGRRTSGCRRSSRRSPSAACSRASPWSSVGGAPTGAAPPMLCRLRQRAPRWICRRSSGSSSLFVIAATLILNCSGFGRRLRAIGNSEWVARLSGVRTGSVIVSPTC